MALEVLGLLGAGVIITVLHTLVPDHWLPFALVGRARRWTRARTLRITLLSALGHVGITIVLGVVIALVSFEFLQGFRGVEGILGAAVLITLGVALAVLQVLRGHDHVHADPKALDGTSQATLFTLSSISPCYPILPLFLAVQDLGWVVTLGLAAAFGIVTAAMMVFLVFLASRGLPRILEGVGFHRLEHYEGVLLGGILVAVGALSLWFPL